LYSSSPGLIKGAVFILGFKFFFAGKGRLDFTLDSFLKETKDEFYGY
jgi:hypothetical protein